MSDQQIFKKMVSILTGLGAIEKNSVNAGQGWKFRGIDDVMAGLYPLLAKHGVFMLPEVVDAQYSTFTTGRGNPMNHVVLRVAYHFVADDGSRVTLVTQGEAADAGDKATSKALAIAMKYAVTQAFCVPTADQPDPDAEINEFSRRERVRPESAEQVYSVGGEQGYTPEQIDDLLEKGKRPVSRVDELFEDEAQRLIAWIETHPAGAK